MIYDISPVNNYQGNSSCTIFDFDFYIENEKQLKVYLFDKDNIKWELKYGIDYSVNEFKNKNGSYIVFPLETSQYNVLKDDEKISLELYLSFSQDTQYNNSSLLNLEALEYSFDYLTRLIQILKRKIDLCVKVEECSDNTPEEIIESINNAEVLTKTYAQEVLEDKNAVNEYLKTVEQKTEIVCDIKDEVNKTYVNKSDKSDVDGQWVSKALNIGDNINVNDANNTGLTYSLAEYLPDDEYDYEVMFRYAIETGSTSGNYVQLDLFAPDYTFPATVSRAITRTSATNQISGICIFPIGASRNITLQRNKYWNGKVNLGCCAYRRLGKNI